MKYHTARTTDTNRLINNDLTARNYEWRLITDYPSLMAEVYIEVVGSYGTYTLLFEVHPSTKGLDNKGSHAVGYAHSTIIDGTVKKTYCKVDMSHPVHTPFGDYIITYDTNKDNLKLTPVELTN